jgi:hypothetical protein
MILAADVQSKPGITVVFGAPGDIPIGGSWLP